MYGEASVLLDEETLEKALSSLSWESSPGVSCVSARMLRNMYQGHAGVAETLLPFANMVVAGRLSSEVMQTWLTGRLCLLPKKAMHGAHWALGVLCYASSTRQSCSKWLRMLRCFLATCSGR